MAKAVVGKYLKDSKILDLIDELKSTGHRARAKILTDLFNAHGEAKRTEAFVRQALVSACEEFQSHWPA